MSVAEKVMLFWLSVVYYLKIFSLLLMDLKIGKDHLCQSYNP
jgi:hypothetical protein